MIEYKVTKCFASMFNEDGSIPVPVPVGVDWELKDRKVTDQGAVLFFWERTTPEVCGRCSKEIEKSKDGKYWVYAGPNGTMTLHETCTTFEERKYGY